MPPKKPLLLLNLTPEDPEAFKARRSGSTPQYCAQEFLPSVGTAGMVEELLGGRKAGGRPREKWFPRVLPVQSWGRGRIKAKPT